MKKVNINWQNYQHLIAKLSKKISFKPNIVVCINRGGLIIGRLFSEILNKPLAIISAKCYQGRKKYPLKIGSISTVDKVKGKVLLVDDLVDSGETLKKVREKVRQIKGVKVVKTATLFIKPKSKLIPDYFVKKVNSWVVFPYEKK